MRQVEHAAREEKDCLEKFYRKWEQLDPMADNEKAKALEAQKVKEHAQAEADRLSRIKSRMREVLELCRPVMDFFGVGIDTIERRALMEEWNKRRLRLYQEFEDLLEPLVVKVNIMSQTPEQEGHLIGMGKLRSVTDDELRRINGHKNRGKDVTTLTPHTIPADDDHFARQASSAMFLPILRCPEGALTSKEHLKSNARLLETSWCALTISSRYLSGEENPRESATVLHQFNATRRSQLMSALSCDMCSSLCNFSLDARAISSACLT